MLSSHGFDEQSWEYADYYEDILEEQRLNRLEAAQKAQPSELDDMLAEYRDIKVELAYPLEKLRYLEQKIKEHVKETGEISEIEGARIQIISPKRPRVYWDTQALESFAARHPSLSKLRTEKWPSPSVRIIVD